MVKIDLSVVGDVSGEIDTIRRPAAGNGSYSATRTANLGPIHRFNPPVGDTVPVGEDQ